LIKIGAHFCALQTRTLRRPKASNDKIVAVSAEIKVREKTVRDLEAQADAIDAATFDLKAFNPNAVAKTDNRSPTQIIQSIESQGRIASKALARLSKLLAENEVVGPINTNKISEPRLDADVGIPTVRVGAASR
jgi:hypothetical protein